jgi:hypothetical protein
VFRFIWSRWYQFQRAVTLHLQTTVMGIVTTDIDYINIIHCCYEHNSDGQCWRQYYPLLMCYSVATDAADVNFCSSLITSKVIVATDQIRPSATVNWIATYTRKFGRFVPSSSWEALHTPRGDPSWLERRGGSSEWRWLALLLWLWKQGLNSSTGYHLEAGGLCVARCWLIW